MQGGGRERLVILGNGMVGHRFLEMYGERAAVAGGGPFDVTVIGEEPRLAYDRVGLSGYFDGKTPDDLALTRPGQYEAAGFAVRLATRARRIDRERRVVEVDGAEIPYDRLLLATGSAPFVPPVPGRDLPGCFVYRTIEDLEAISAWAGGHPGGVGAVIGGGLLGLEAAYALKKLGMEVHVIELAPRLMALPCSGAASRSWASSCTPRPPAARSPAPTAACARWSSRTAASWTSTRSCSRPASARATSWRAPPA